MAIKFISIPTKVLADSITSSASSFTLNNITGWDGNDLTSGDFGTTGYGVFRNATNSNIEFFEFDPSTIASSSITITRRGLKFDAADLTTEVSANKRSWNKGDTFVDLGTDTPQMLQWLKEYIDAASIAGAVPMTDAVQGIAKLSTAAATPSDPIVVGDNDPRVPTAGENDAMAGGGNFGTPSTSNKFLTQDFMDAGFSDRVTFTSSGTWTKDSGLVRVRVQAWGGGGGGINNVSQGGGGGGGYSEKWFEASELGATETVTIGAGGGATGGDGGNTTFGSLLTAYGGEGGGGSAGGNAGGPTQAGTAGSGAMNAAGSGSAGEDGIFGGAGGFNTTDGGSAYWGGGGGTGTGTAGVSIHGGDGGANGVAGTQPGGGGGTSAVGGAGQIIVTEYYS